MASITYSIMEKNTLNPRSVGVYPTEVVFRQVMVREFPDALVVSHDEDDYSLDVYDVNGSAVIITGEEVKIISSDGAGLTATKDSLEERLRYFTLTKRDNTEKD